MDKDKLFDDSYQKVTDFEFNRAVVSVFDDMVVRSVPFYLEIQRMITELAADFVVEGTQIYDLGCSTGTTMMNMDKVIDPKIRFVGIDNSDEMLKSCRKNLKSAGIIRDIDLVKADINNGVLLENPSVVILCLTLQFVRPLYREKLVKSIFDQLPQNGALIVIEKVLCEATLFNRMFIKYYYDFKKANNYSQTELAKKREELENVLIPYKLKENEAMLKDCGFKHVELFFKWFNFSGIVAMK